MAYVSQDNYLFDDTLRENIRMGNLSATNPENEKDLMGQDGIYSRFVQSGEVAASWKL